MLSEICLYLRNWFNEGQPQYFGNFKIQNGELIFQADMGIQENQYYRITGSVFNNGVHKKGSEKLIDESFYGGVWLMAVPPEVEGLAADIAAWQEAYGGATSQNMSPYASESFRGYSYTKSSGGGSGSSSSVPTWQSVFADRLLRYKKI